MQFTAGEKERLKLPVNQLTGMEGGITIYGGG